MNVFFRYHCTIGNLVEHDGKYQTRSVIEMSMGNYYQTLLILKLPSNTWESSLVPDMISPFYGTEAVYLFKFDMKKQVSVPISNRQLIN